MSNMTKEQLSETLDTVKPYEAHCSKSESRKTKIQDQSVDSMEHLIQRFQQEAEAREMILNNNLLSAIDARLQRKYVSRYARVTCQFNVLVNKRTCAAALN